MKINHVILISNQIALIPYQPHHVKTYHQWMSDPEMLKQTASERLTLEEEYKMQMTWTEDKDKLTFILMDLNKWNREEIFPNHCISRQEKQECLDKLECSCIFGDVNLFLDDLDDKGSRIAEVSIMVAPEGYRRKGYASKVLKNLFSYSYEELNLKCVRAKIGFENQPSIRLFEQKLHFAEVERCEEPFHEITFQRDMEDFLNDSEVTIKYRLEDYDTFRAKKLHSANVGIF